MAPSIAPVATSETLPNSTDVVVIGGGLVGLMAALCLAERGIGVTVLDKGRIAGEQSSRNLGWVRKMGRDTNDLPLAILAEQLWVEMAQRLGQDVGYTRSGTMYVVRSQKELAKHERWLETVREFQLDSRLLTPAEIEDLVPGGVGDWVGGLYTPSDGKAEPTLAAGAAASTALAKGAQIVEYCAARSLILSNGAVRGVVTEKGEISCCRVILAGGLWSRRFLGNLGLAYPTLPVCASVLRTRPMDGPTDIGVGAPDFSFRKSHLGGYIITQRGAFTAPIVPDTFRLGHKYLPTLIGQWQQMRISFGQEFMEDWRLPRRWEGDQESPFEQVRVKDPGVDEALNREALRNLASAWPAFERAEIEESWSGMIEITPDGMPVISTVAGQHGLILATGFSGHGFGTAPAAGQLAAELAMDAVPSIDPAPYDYTRFS